MKFKWEVGDVGAQEKERGMCKQPVRQIIKCKVDVIRQVVFTCQLAYFHTTLLPPTPAVNKLLVQQLFLYTLIMHTQLQGILLRALTIESDRQYY